MGKYVRTRTNIYKVFGETEKVYYVGCSRNRSKERMQSKSKVIAKADTIEELCDEAVFFDDNKEPHYKSKEGSIWYLGASLFTESLRFAIWTDKGLIYVAKVNEDGELELI